VRRLALVLLVQAACALPGGDVLSKSKEPAATPFTTCADALAGGTVGDA
jgi:hypothetical protein